MVWSVLCSVDSRKLLLETIAMCSIDLAGSIVRFYDPPIGYISSNVSGDYSGSSSHRSYSSPSSSSSNRVSKSSSSRSSYSSSSRLTVYIDGACSNNQSSNARASVGVYFSAGKSDDVSRPVAGSQQIN